MNPTSPAMPPMMPQTMSPAQGQPMFGSAKDKAKELAGNARDFSVDTYNNMRPSTRLLTLAGGTDAVTLATDPTGSTTGNIVIGIVLAALTGIGYLAGKKRSEGK